MVKKRKRKRDGESSPETGGETYASDRKTDEPEMANVTVERSLRDVKCRDATIDIECRRRDVGTCRDANVSKFCNRTPAAGNDISASKQWYKSCISYFLILEIKALKNT